MCHKENKSLFFLTSLNMAKLFHQKLAIFNMITYFLVEKCGILERARGCACRNLLNSDCQDRISFSIFQVADVLIS